MIVPAGSLAPEFELVNQHGQTVALAALRASGPVALVFFPVAFTGICTGELCELRDNLAMFQDAGVTLVAVSVDNKATLRVFAEREGYDFDLLADFWPHGAVARAYGAFDEEKGVATRATFLIDREGIIRASFEAAPGGPRDLAQYRDALGALAAT